jgi:hypothetical protein
MDDDQSTGGRPEITLVRWPEQEATRAALRAERRPRMLLLNPNTPAPEPGDELEDWVRIPVAEADLRARVRWLAHRVASGQVVHRSEARPVLDDDGLFRVGDEWVALPPVEHRLARALLDRLGTVVTRDALAQAGWPDGAPGRNALDVHVLRLRRRLAPLHMTIHTVRSRGYLLAMSAPSTVRASGT